MRQEDWCIDAMSLRDLHVRRLPCQESCTTVSSHDFNSQYFRSRVSSQVPEPLFLFSPEMAFESSSPIFPDLTFESWPYCLTAQSVRAHMWCVASRASQPENPGAKHVTMGPGHSRCAHHTVHIRINCQANPVATPRQRESSDTFYPCLDAP